MSYIRNVHCAHVNYHIWHYFGDDLNLIYGDLC